MGPLPRRALAAVAAVVAGGGWLFLASRDAPPEARLRPGAGAGGTGRPDGEWVVAPDADGFVGYRVRERLGSVSAPNDVVVRSPGVSGTVTIAGGAHLVARRPRIACARAEPFQFSPPPSVHRARPDGSGRRDLTPGQPSFQPDWSPDGRRLAVAVTGTMETTEISIIDLDGSPVSLLDDTPSSDSEPRWPPDGRRLAVSAYWRPAP